MRTGLIAEKIGMTRLFQDDGTQVPVTVLKVEPNVVLELIRQEERGYTAVKLGAGQVKKIRNVAKPQKGYFAKLNQEPQTILREFRVSDDHVLTPGTILTAGHFIAGQFVDVSGYTVGKGFAGPMKRYGFGGLRATHGVSVSHRSHGSTGNRQDPGKVFKNKKMAGHMGDRMRTLLNLKVHAIDAERGLVFIKGAVPGSKGSRLYVRDAVKKTTPDLNQGA